MDNKTFMNVVVCNNKKSNKISFYLISGLLLALVTAFFVLLDPVGLYMPIVTQFSVLTIALFGLGGFYTSKSKLLSKYDRTTAYRKAFWSFHVTFIPFIYMAAAHSYFSHGVPIYDNWIFKVLRYGIAIYLLSTGLILHTKTRKIFGLDNLFMYYVYHPDESIMVESVIHKIIRHPIYSAMNRICWAGAFIQGSWVSIVVATLFSIEQYLWLLIYEEPDLINRFGDGYKSFKQNVPALYANFRDFRRLIKFLLGLEK